MSTSNGESTFRSFTTKTRELIATHPIAAVGIALGLGYAIAMRPKSAISRLLISTAVGTSFAVLRELATQRVVTGTRSWLDEQVRAHPVVG
jgi:hypothetical protein